MVEVNSDVTTAKVRNQQNERKSMNIIYRSKEKNAQDCLAAPPEAARGLKCIGGRWQLYVSDPEAVAVAAFRLRQETLTLAAEDIHRDVHPPKQLTVEDATELLGWLVAQNYVKADLLDTGGLPSMFPGFPPGGPKAALNMKSPAISR